ncbi:MAG: flippase-like domain-containing protein [DPANN group archaeon]|nr:flippase-like domain-containing protein [DPANN group archaeon]
MKNFAWLLLSFLILAAIYALTGPEIALHNLNFTSIAVAELALLSSIWAWGIAWGFILGLTPKQALKSNTRAMLGIFAPLGFGADAIRAMEGKRYGLRKRESISASFIVKLFKFLLMLLFLGFSILLLKTLSIEPGQQISLFIGAIVFTSLGILFIIAASMPDIARLIGKKFKKSTLLDFQQELYNQLKQMSLKKSIQLTLILLASSLLEITAVLFTFDAISRPVTSIHAFIYSAISHSLALITVTPQGLGFVETGSYLVLQSGFFSFPAKAIGLFIILWAIIRIWVPSLLGLASYKLLRHD